MIRKSDKQNWCINPGQNRDETVKQQLKNCLELWVSSATTWMTCTQYDQAQSHRRTSSTDFLNSTNLEWHNKILDQNILMETDW